MEYILRACICKHGWEDYTKKLIAACKHAKITELMLTEDNDFIGAMAQPLSSHREMAEILKKAVKMILDSGIKCGFYVKAVLGHSVNNHSFQLPYTKFVGENGEVSLCECCISDKEFVEYMKEVFVIYSQCGFEYIMIDDDFRSTNHCNHQDGCFCELHLKRTSELYGKTLDRETIVKALKNRLKDAESKKIAECFQTANFEGQLYAAQVIERGVHAVNTDIRIGVMTSNIEADEFQGRDMDKLLQAFAGEGRKPFIRPSGGYFRDTVGDALLAGQSWGWKYKQYLGDSVDWISEIEIFSPRNSFTKSLKWMDLQIQSHVMCGFDRESFNFIDHYSTDPMECNEYLDYLRDNFDRYDSILNLVKDKKFYGVGVPLRKGRMGDFYNQPAHILWANKTLMMLNIPICYEETEVNFISGIDASSYTDEDILRLLKKGAIVDQDAVKVLCERGYSHLLGVQYLKEVEVPCFEVLTDSVFSGGYENDRFPVHIGNKGELPTFVYKAVENAEILTELKDAKLRTISPATVLYENELGGRVMCLATPFMHTNWFFKGRFIQMQKAIEYLSFGKFPFILENTKHISPYYMKGETDDLVILYNYGFDKETFTIVFSDGVKKEMSVDGLTIEYFRLHELKS